MAPGERKFPIGTFMRKDTHRETWIALVQNSVRGKSTFCRQTAHILTAEPQTITTSFCGTSTLTSSTEPASMSST